MGLLITAAVASVAVSAWSAYESDKAMDDANDEARKQNRIAKTEQEQATDIAEGELELQNERLQEWEETFGSLEDNLTEHYNNLDPDDRRREGFEAEKERHQAFVKETRKTSIINEYQQDRQGC